MRERVAHTHAHTARLSTWQFLEFYVPVPTSRKHVRHEYLVLIVTRHATHLETILFRSSVWPEQLIHTKECST